MAKYNKDLLKKIQDQTGYALGTVYKGIDRITTDSGAPAAVAVLIFAKTNGVAFKRFAKENELRDMATYSNNNAQLAVSAKVPSEKKHKKTKLKKPRVPDPKSVFMIHGRNAAVNKSMHAFLRSIGLSPVEFSSAIHATIKKKKAGGNPFVGEVLDLTFERVKALIVLFTPDDEVQLRKEFVSKTDGASEKKLVPQARPNVIFEAGLALGRHEEKTIFVSVGKTKQFSDIAGRHMLYLNNTSVKRRDFARRLEAMGCQISLEGDDWENSGDFVA